ncbi:hypothetical protein PHYBLDRAFT_172549 [Phycomyces blakesleeanus NRRL 1555(-)]|uniref:Uncharacterized protein n=1 Tax=Phycomyces blakesleeanus (strain ATCC 8743b / DSM 1359 / FGSC 10004 / NBRC 33097 / NRRL 1555) TaxID=763407 RepID=A0A167L0C8_PHYB8|nr:hypothetical protein PHYBLDRAFT_172549 [Phycomyces blakesleeanus NRRL 1555(-)]OAD69298.1 hypothetical protein PHYBLDRAFT_172549 [Phycomyces blakesleeanus NRRL 1555(-)]|eukprot:XP_018287338.1 hypothetical protein PHYBLDRAFT_172549 [Phycomyces blakesleeanus NRRL 1555(-)]
MAIMLIYSISRSSSSSTSTSTSTSTGAYRILITMYKDICNEGGLILSKRVTCNISYNAKALGLEVQEIQNLQGEESIPDFVLFSEIADFDSQNRFQKNIYTKMSRDNLYNNSLYKYICKCECEYECEYEYEYECECVKRQKVICV